MWESRQQNTKIHREWQYRDCNGWHDQDHPCIRSLLIIILSATYLVLWSTRLDLCLISWFGGPRTDLPLQAHWIWGAPCVWLIPRLIRMHILLSTVPQTDSPSTATHPTPVNARSIGMEGQIRLRNSGPNTLPCAQVIGYEIETKGCSRRARWQCCSKSQEDKS